MTDQTQPDSSTELVDRLERLMERLGFSDGPSLVRSMKDYDAVTYRHVMQQAFDVIRVRAVFGFAAVSPSRQKSFTPILYFCVAGTDADADAQHRLAWSQGIAPIMLVATPGGLQIRKSLGPPNGRPNTVAWEKVSGTAQLPVELASLHAVALRSSVVWNDFVVDRKSRVDSALLTAIIDLNNAVSARFKKCNIEPGVINSVIGRFIYFFVLMDRGIISAEWLGKLKNASGKQLCPAIASSLSDANTIPSDAVWPASEVWAAFNTIDEILNGAIFPIPEKDRKAFPVDALHLVRRVIRHGDIVSPDARQLGFLNVSFATLRTETISAIYELFLAIESPEERDEDGVYYTPPFLVDYVLDEVDRSREFVSGCRVIDPAAGSGIFLVGAFRRIVERNIRKERWTPSDFRRARKLLETCVFGVERNTQAANVARFSLYLTLLDYIGAISIEKLQTYQRGEKLFPSLKENIVDCDIFDPKLTSRIGSKKFTHVVGNPPWGTIGDRNNRLNARRGQARTSEQGFAAAYLASLDEHQYPVTNKRLSELFVWKIRQDLIASDGALGILVSTRSFVSRSATKFPNAVAKEFRLSGLANFSHFRYRLFEGARSPTIALFASSSSPDNFDPVWVYSPLLTSQPIGQTGHLWSVIPSELDIGRYRLRDLTRSDDGWFSSLILRPVDRQYASYLRAWSAKNDKTLQSFVAKAGLAFSRGGSPAQTGLSAALLLNAQNYRAALGFEGLGLGSYPHEKLRPQKIEPAFRAMFGGNIIFIPRHMNEVYFVEKPIAFGSTFNAVYAKDYKGTDAALKKGLRGVARFLNAAAAHYLYALYGRSWQLDHARLEKHDLLAIPFPFDGLTDSSLQQLDKMTDDEVTKLFARLVGLDAAFSAVVNEYTSFRSGYEDSQIPAAGLTAPTNSAVERYREALTKRLTVHFGGRAKITERMNAPTNDFPFGQLEIEVGRAQTIASAGNAATLSVRSGTNGFVPISEIEVDIESGKIRVAKPWTKVAWTIEQAFTDADSIRERVVRAGVS